MMGQAAETIQLFWRAYTVRKRFLCIRKSVCMIQARVRGNAARERLKKRMKNARVLLEGNYLIII